MLFAITGTVGFATPVGFAGLEAEYSPLPWLGISAGAGHNLSGLQAAGMLRLRFTPSRPRTFYVGAGYSQGHHEQDEHSRFGVFSAFLKPLESMGHAPPPQKREWETARWLNLELGLEKRDESGFILRGYVGAALLLNPAQHVLSEREKYAEHAAPITLLMAYAGFALGDAF